MSRPAPLLSKQCRRPRNDRETSVGYLARRHAPCVSRSARGARMSDMRDAGGLGREQFIIGLADMLKDCADVHDPYERILVILKAVETHEPEAYRRAVMRPKAVSENVRAIA